MGRTFHDSGLESKGYGDFFIIKGFIDDDIHALDNYPNYPPVLGSITDYNPQCDDVFICSMGGPSRKNCMEQIIRRGGVFINLIHNTVRIYTNAKLGIGNFVGAFSVIGNDSVIGNYNMIQSYTVIGHDAVIGDFNRIDTHVTCVGGVKIQNDATIHTSAVIGNNVTVENCAKIGACSFVIRKVKSGDTVLGVPAKKI